MKYSSCSIPVRYADTDAQAVVFFANYLTYMDEAATAHLEAIGLPYAALRALDVDFVYANTNVRYLSSIRHGDALVADCVITAIGTTSFTTRCSLRVGEVICAEGELVQVCIDGERSKTRVPDALREAAGLG
jgi:acyl-CoA thioester hydrolase